MKAFPWQEWINSTDPYIMNPISHGGMDLRDYFASKAMEGFLNCYGHNIKYAKDELIATASYELADAMMKAREK